MKEHPIIFSGPTVPGILDGRKTQTRRVIKPQPPENTSWDEGSMLFVVEGSRLGVMRNCPYGKAGDRLWVRERTKVLNVYTPASVCHTGIEVPLYLELEYQADGLVAVDVPYPNRLKWKPVIGECLPRGGYRESSRITLEITNLRVERVHEITEDDARAEGAKYGHLDGERSFTWYGNDRPPHSRYSFRDGFHMLWDAINAKRGYGWEKNPWVWAISFKRIEP